VIARALREPRLSASVWPFQGELDALLGASDVVFVETYPAEACLHIGLSPPGTAWSKKQQDDRRMQGERLLTWAQQRGVILSQELTSLIRS